MALAELSFDAKSGIATITLNRPEVLNAIDVPTARALRDVVTELPAEARCIVLRGAGRAFAAGGDLARFAEDFDQADMIVHALLDSLHAAVLGLMEHRAPVLASVQGAAAGAGLSLMTAADLVIAADNARFLVAYDRIGNAPDCGGTWQLPRLLGRRRANEFMLLSEQWDAATAERHGLINRVVPADQLAAETDQLAAKIAAGPTIAYATWKRLSNAAFEQPLAVQLEQERAAFAAGTRTEDFRAGVSAFLAKKPVTFTGK